MSTKFDFLAGDHIAVANFQHNMIQMTLCWQASWQTMLDRSWTKFDGQTSSLHTQQLGLWADKLAGDDVNMWKWIPG